MAPRRKRTAPKNTRSKRGKPKLKLPEGDFDTSMTVEEQENKLNNYIADYELQVKRKVDKLRKYTQTLKGLITNVYKSVLIELTKSVKEMTMEEFMRKGGTVDTVISAEVQASLTGFVNNPTQALAVPSASRLPLANLSNTIDIAGLSMDQSSMMSQLSGASNVQTAGKSTRKRKVKIVEDKPSATGTRASRRLQEKSFLPNNEITPMQNMSTMSILNQTAFITPKFDPRLPIPSTLIREPKAGERIVSMSGSPLANPAGPGNVSAPKVFIPLAGGKTMQLSVDDKSTMNNNEEIDVANDSVAQQNIRLLQEKLSKLLRIPEEME